MRSLYLALLIVFWFTSVAQSQKSWAVELSAMNVLYKGITNPVRISVSGVDHDKIVTKTSSNLKLENNLITVLGDRQGFVKVGELIDGDTNWIGKQTFRIRPLPNPIAQLGGIPNDGLPKAKAAVLAQTTVIAPMGMGFAYNLHFKVTHSRLVVQYLNDVAYIEEVDSNSLTTTMRQALRRMQNGDLLILEEIRAKEIKYGFEANLNPIIHSFRGDRRKDYNVYSNLKYLRRGDKVVTDSISLSKEIDSLVNATYSLVYNSDFGFHKKEITVKDSVVVEEKLFNDNGSILYYNTKNNNDAFETSMYHPNQVKRMICSHKEQMQFGGNVEYAQWLRQIKYGRDTGLVTDSFMLDFYDANTKYGINPFGPCKTFYNNGNIKAEGQLVFAYRNNEEFAKTQMAMSVFPFKDNLSVMHGTWYFYQPNGNLLETRKYELGVRLK